MGHARLEVHELLLQLINGLVVLTLLQFGLRFPTSLTLDLAREHHLESADLFSKLHNEILQIIGVISFHLEAMRNG